MKMNGLMTGVLVVIGIALGFLLGRTTGESDKAGNDASAAGGERQEGPGKSDRHAGALGSRGAERSGKSGRSAAATIRQAARDLELSPMASMDFDAMFGAYDAIRWMNAEEIQIALAELDDAVSNPQIKMVMAMMLINHWAKEDGRGAVEYALQQQEGMLKSMGVMGGIMGWVKDDPEGAYAWYQENREKLAKGGMMAGQMDGMILAALSHRDMKKAFEGLSGLNRQSQVMALSVMGSQMTMDPVKREEFIREVESLEDEDLRKQGLEGMIGVWAFQDPRGAVEFIDSREWEGEIGESLRERLASSWASMDAEAALQYRLDHIGENQNRAEVVANGFSQWMAQDPESAQEWLNAQPEEVRSDQLYQQTASQLRWRNDYDEAVAWAVQIEEQSSRESTLRDIYGAWTASDEASAQKWIEGLDEGTRAAVEAGPGEAELLEATEEAPQPTVLDAPVER